MHTNTATHTRRDAAGPAEKAPRKRTILTVSARSVPPAAIFSMSPAPHIAPTGTYTPCPLAAAAAATARARQAAPPPPPPPRFKRARCVRPQVSAQNIPLHHKCSIQISASEFTHTRSVRGGGGAHQLRRRPAARVQWGTRSRSCAHVPPAAARAARNHTVPNHITPNHRKSITESHTMPNQISHHIKSSHTKSDQINSHQVKPHQINSHQVKPHQITPNAAALGGRDERGAVRRRHVRVRNLRGGGGRAACPALEWREGKSPPSPPQSRSRRA